jgi:parvulin-like peptidyl-prolyl isomerase
MKFYASISAALLSGVIASQAATQTAAAGTNISNPTAAMTALFGDPVIAKGKGFELKRSDLTQVVSAAKSTMAAASQPVPSNIDILTLEQLINIQALAQMATPADQAAGQLDADQQYTNLLAQFRSTDEFLRLLKAKGMTVEDLRAKATQEAVAKAALKRELNINVSDEQSKDYYNQHPATFEQPELVHVRHILLLTIDPSVRPPLPLSTNEVAAKRQKIEDLRKQLVAGGDFEALARQFSEDTSTATRGGELPLFPRGKMVPAFEAAAFALGTNEISQVITTEYGFHLIKMIEKVAAKKIDFTTANPEIKSALTEQKIHELAPAYIKKLRVEEKVEVLDPVLKAQDDEVTSESNATEAPASGAATPAATGAK